jgi:O-antigen/teichoic acid export membrane protein
MNEAGQNSQDRDGSHTLVINMLSTALGFVGSVLIARILGPAGKGMLDVVGATTALLSLLLGFSLQAGVTHALAQTGAWPARLGSGLAGWSLLSGLVTAAALVTLAPAAQRLGLLPAADTSFWALCVALGVALAIASTTIRGALTGLNRVVAANRAEFALRAGSILAFAGLAWWTQPGPRSFIIVTLSTTTLLLVIYLLTLGKPTPGPPAWPTILATSLPLHGSNILHFLTVRVDVFFVQAWYGSSEVGIYVLATTLAQTVLLVSNAFGVPLLPLVAAEPGLPRAVALSTRAVRLFLVLAGAGAVLLAVVTPLLLARIFGRGFTASVPALLLLLPGVLAFGITNILTSFFVGVGRPRINLAISLTGLVVTLAGNLTLTRQAGAMGAAAASTLAYAASAVVAIACLKRIDASFSLAALLPRAPDVSAASRFITRFRL